MSAVLKPIVPIAQDLALARRFLTLLDEVAEQFTFQTFDDLKSRKSDSLARILHGTINQHFDELVDYQQKGAGVFVLAQRGNSKGRRTENVTAIRCVFQEDDGDGKSLPLEPHIVVESSPGKYHCYLLVDDLSLDERDLVQQVLIDQYGSDPKAKDRARVLRLPGFLHQKDPAHPHLVNVIHESGTRPYTRDQILAAFKPAPIGNEKAPAGSASSVRVHTQLQRDLRSALFSMRADDRDLWIAMAHALRDLDDIGRGLWLDWSISSELYEVAEAARVWDSIKDPKTDYRAVFAAAQARGWANPASGSRPKADVASLEDFHAYMPEHRYLYVPTGDLWPASSVDSRCAWPKDADDKPFAPHKWLDQHRAIEQMTWSPGEPQLIVDRVVQGGGWIQKPGGKVFNLYRPPTLIPGDCHGASRWRDHLRAIYPDDADHIERWFAQRIQHPEIKLNHALVLGGAQGIGKDSLCEPVKQAVGPWNWCDISPTTMIGRFNGWTKAVIVRVSEARDLGDVNRFAFYEHSKTYIAAPPDVLRVDEKNCREYPIVNAIGLLITTNYKCDGIYLPPDDRRHYIAWSDITREAFDDAYWREFWGWLQAGGINAVAAFLRSLDLSNFDPKAPPTKTEAFYAIVQANANPEESELADLIDRIGMPTVLTLELLADSSHASMEFKQQLTDRTKRRTWPHRMERVGYVPIRNAAAPSDGAWKVNRRRQVVYARRELTVSDRLLQVQKFVATGRVSSV